MIRKQISIEPYSQLSSARKWLTFHFDSKVTAYESDTNLEDILIDPSKLNITVD